MSDKAAKKKQFILDTAKKVFTEKGFKNVTMKDIVDACEISRGGLYIYFDSTESVFEEILSQEYDVAKNFESVFKEQESAGDSLALLLNEMKKELLGSGNLFQAIYEYMFWKQTSDIPLDKEKNSFEKATEIFEKLIDSGVDSGEFYAEDSKQAALNIMYAFEGLKVLSTTIGITERQIDEELIYIMSGLIAEE